MTKPATKSNIRAAYIEALQARYPFYTEGSRSLEMAYAAVDNAMAGKVRLSRETWLKVLAEHGLSKRTTMVALMALPE